MALLRSPVFIICCVLFLAHQLIKLFYDQSIPFIDAHLDNLLAMPIILTLLLWERIYLFRWKEYPRLSILEIVLGTLFIAFISEIVFPAFSDDFTGDWIDVIFFFLGAVLFYFTINPDPEEMENRNTPGDD